MGLLLLLLFNPSVPWGSPGGSPERWVLVDASASMGARLIPGDGPPDASSGRTPWDRVRDRVDASASPLLLFGEEPRRVDSLPGTLEAGAGSRLGPALRRAAEGGAREVRVLTDLRIEDGGAARTEARRLALEVEVEDVGGPVANVGVAGFRLPDAVAAGDTVRGEVEVFAGTGDGDSLTVEVRGPEGPVARLRILRPSVGRTVRAPVAFAAPEEDGPARYEARVEGPDDGFPRDDARVAYTEVDPVEGQLVLVSLAPDWEPRFLLPVLARVTGLPPRGYLALDGGRFLAMDPRGGPSTVGADEVRARARSAELLVVQGGGEATPSWLREALATVPRRILLQGVGSPAPGLPDAVGEARGGEWYLVPRVPTSPLAAALASLELRGLPPLSDLRSWPGEPPTSPPLLAQPGGVGEADPVLVLRSVRGREAVLLARGTWRWAFRPGEAREAYERLWSATAGWLLEAPGEGPPGVRPTSRVQSMGQPVSWNTPGRAGDSLALRVEGDRGAVVDTVVRVPEGAPVRTPSLPAGRYTWEARALEASDTAAGSGPGGWEGSLEVEDWSGDLRHPRDTLLARDDAAGAVEAAGRSGRPLRTHPLPWLLVLGALCAEWIGRRRRGLR
jgi:hypothetical protein